MSPGWRRALIVIGVLAVAYVLGVLALVAMGRWVDRRSWVTLSQLPAEYANTEPGSHRLSPYFEVVVNSEGIARFYHDRIAGQSFLREEIGRQHVTGYLSMAFTSIKYGPRVTAFSISPSGRSLLFFHDRRLAAGLGESDDSALHLYRHGVGDTILEPLVHHGIKADNADAAAPDGVLYRSASRESLLYRDAEGQLTLPPSFRAMLDQARRKRAEAGPRGAERR